MKQSELHMLFMRKAAKTWKIDECFFPHDGEIDERVYPSKKNIFKAFELVDLKDVKYVLMGQDPYFTTFGDVTPHATGVAFGVPNGCPPKELPPSLKKILGKICGSGDAQDKSLEEWARKKKILLLNAALTVPRPTEAERSSKRHVAGRHIGKWDDFVGRALELVSKNGNKVEFICWGRASERVVKQALKGTELPDNIPFYFHPAASIKKDNKKSFDEFWKSDVGRRLTMK